MWKDWKVMVKWKLKKWSIYYWTNFLDKNYKAKEPWNLIWLFNFEKEWRQARIEEYTNCITFDIRELWKDGIYHNVDWNDEEIIWFVKMTKRTVQSVLWITSYVIWLWYTFVGQSFYDENWNNLAFKDL